MEATAETMLEMWKRVPESGMRLLLICGSDYDREELGKMLKGFELQGALKLDEDRGVDWEGNPYIVLFRAQGPDPFLQLFEHVEAVEPADSHWLQGLQDMDQGIRNEAYEEIVGDRAFLPVMTRCRDYGLNLSHSLVSEGPFNLLEFRIVDGFDEVGLYHLDGWSGSLRFDGNWHVSDPMDDRGIGFLMDMRVSTYIEDANKMCLSSLNVWR